MAAIPQLLMDKPTVCVCLGGGGIPSRQFSSGRQPDQKCPSNSPGFKKGSAERHGGRGQKGRGVVERSSRFPTRCPGLNLCGSQIPVTGCLSHLQLYTKEIADLIEHRMSLWNFFFFCMGKVTDDSCAVGVGSGYKKRLNFIFRRLNLASNHANIIRTKNIYIFQV